MTVSVDPETPPSSSSSSKVGQVITGVVASLLTSAIIWGVTEWRLQESERIRGRLQGVWALRTLTDSTSYTPYDGLTIDFMLSITVDASYNVSGEAYKVSEHTKGGSGKTYDRKEWMRALVKGSIINDRVMLTFDAVDAAGLRSAHAFQGVLSFRGDQGLLAGEFRNDVANQTGRFCANRVAIAKGERATAPNCGL